MGIKFVDNRVKVMGEIDDRIEAFIEEAKDSLASQAARNTKRVTGQLADSFTIDSYTEIENNTATAYIGSSVEHSIYYELGTGEYALEGNGRQGGWVYRDKATGKFYWTKGQTPKRPLYRAYIQKRDKLQSRAERILSDE